MERTVQELKTLIRDLIFELGDLKERVARLEGGITSDTKQINYSHEHMIKLQGEGYEHLGRIYEEGFHVCPVAYGQPRQDGCLFCIAFMGKD